MEIETKTPPRRFRVGDGSIELAHMADVSLAPDELVTFVSAGGTQYDVARKDWGYYATPSLNGRLPAHGLKPVLVSNSRQQLFLLLVEDGRQDAWRVYCRREGLAVVAWLDDVDVGDLRWRLADLAGDRP